MPLALPAIRVLFRATEGEWQRPALRRLSTAVFWSLLLSPAAQAESVGLSFEAAEQQLVQRSHALGAAQAGVDASRDQSEALKSLWMPVVSLDAQELRYQKTITVPLDAAQSAAASGVSQFIQGLPAQLPPGTPPALADQIVSQLSQTLPGLVNSIPASVSFKVRETLFRPTLSAVMPIYTGGAISATQKTAEGMVSLSQAGLDETRDQLEVRLVENYFGLQLAQQTRALAAAHREGFRHHLDDARQLQAQGVISKGQYLQVEVAFNAAGRQYEQALSQEQTATVALANLLRSPEAVQPQTPLFVISAPLEDLQGFMAAAEKQFPPVRRAEAQREIARQGVEVASAGYLPSLYLFGQSSLDRDSELVTDPDWVIGIGLHYTLFSNTDRSKSESAARARLRGAEEAGAQVRNDIRTLTLRAWTEVETARKVFLTYNTDIAAAQENLRVQELSFKEGEATAAAVIDARNALHTVLTERAATAYRYDVALAALLSASGQVQRYGDYVKRADLEVRNP